MSSPGLISFARGAPSPDITPPEALRRAADAALRNDPAGTLAYGSGAGYGPLRDWVAERHGVSVEQVLATNGSLQAGMLLFDVVVLPGDLVVVESPSYDRTLLGLLLPEDIVLVKGSRGMKMEDVVRILTTGNS